MGLCYICPDIHTSLGTLVKYIATQTDCQSSRSSQSSQPDAYADRVILLHHNFPSTPDAGWSSHTSWSACFTCLHPQPTSLARPSPACCPPLTPFPLPVWMALPKAVPPFPRSDSLGPPCSPGNPVLLLVPALSHALDAAGCR